MADVPIGKFRTDPAFNEGNRLIIMIQCSTEEQVSSKLDMPAQYAAQMTDMFDIKLISIYRTFPITNSPPSLAALFCEQKNEPRMI